MSGKKKQNACGAENVRTGGLEMCTNEDEPEGDPKEEYHAHSEQPHHRLSAPLTAHSDILSVVAT